MTVFDSIILGLIQGSTEFLPISSSGHLIIVRELFNWHGNTDLAFDAVLQLATILALIVYFWKDIWKLITSFFLMVFGKIIEQKEKIMIWAIIYGTIPAIFAGLILQKYMETTFRSAMLVCVILIIGSGIMYLAEKFSLQLRHSNRSSDQSIGENKELTVKKGVIVGFFQCLALVPGFSRSGATISGGLFMGLNRGEATRFSFLLSVPIVFGSGLKEFISLAQTGILATVNLNLFFGSLTAFVVGIFAIDFLIKFLKKYSLNVFIYYRLTLAVIVLSILFLK